MFSSRSSFFARKLPIRSLARSSSNYPSYTSLDLYHPHKKERSSFEFSLQSKTLFLSSLVAFNNQDEDDEEEKELENYPLHYKKIKEVRLKWEQVKEEILDEIAPDTTQEHYRELEKRMVETLVGQAIEIKSLYEETHFVFIHGQSTQFTTLLYLIKEMDAKKNGKDPKNKFFKYLRKPRTLDSEVLDPLINYAKDGGDHHLGVREIMLSADLYFQNQSSAESAASFYSQNVSMLQYYHLRRLAAALFVSDTTQYESRIYEKHKVGIIIETMSEIIKQNSLCGSIVMILIPKNYLKNAVDAESIVYRSHPFGVPCKCHGKELHLDIMQKLQNNILDNTTQCKRGVPQYRLIIPSLTPESGTLIFALTPFTKPNRKKIKDKIKQILDSQEEEEYLESAYFRP